MGLKVNTGAICDIRFGTGSGSVSIPIAKLGDGSVVFESKRNLFAYGSSYSGNKMMEVSEDYDKAFLDGSDSASVNSGVVVYGMAYGNGVFVAACIRSNTAYIYSSKYGRLWTSRVMIGLGSNVYVGVTGIGLAIDFNPNTNKFSCVARGANHRVVFLSSTDGETWTSGTEIQLTGCYLQDFGRCGNGFLAMFHNAGTTSGYGSEAYYSEDGGTYSRNAALSSSSITYNGFAVDGNGLIVVVGYNASTSKIFSKTSISSGSLTSRKSVSSQTEYYTFVYFSELLGKFFVSYSNDTTKLLVSENGTSWSSSVTLPSSLIITENCARRCIFEHGGYVWFRKISSKNILRTSNGSSWADLTANTCENIKYMFSPDRGS